MFDEILKNRLEDTLKKNLESSSIIAEIEYRPAFDSLGKHSYCQVRKRKDDIFICYVYFDRKEFFQLYSHIPLEFRDFNNSMIWNSFSGLITVNNDTANELYIQIGEIASLKSYHSTSIGLDGYSHTVKINDNEFFWWCEPKSKRAIICNKFVTDVFSLLPAGLRAIE